MKHMMNHPVNKPMIIRYFGGLCTSDETVLIEEWLQQEGNETLMQQWLWEDWQETSGAMPEETAMRLKAILATQTGRRSPVIPMKRKLYYGIAAAAVSAIIVAGSFLLSHQRLAADSQPIVYRDSIYNKGQTPYKAVLADGSAVWLNTDAVLYIAADFGHTTRHVKIKGEAFFDIQPNARQPFYTEAGGITAQVLGTTYAIEAYPSEKEVHVSLISGSVAIHAADTTCMLVPGEMISYTGASGNIQVTPVATTDPSDWIKGRIVLNKLALPEALDRLGRLYHTTIQYDRTQIQDKYITGGFDRDSLPVVLQSILFVHNLHYRPLTNGGYQVH